MTMGIIANVIIIILELIGLRISIKRRRWKIFAFYTQLSNIVTLVSSAAFLILYGTQFATHLRYLSSCMLAMTFLITLFVLVPMGGGLKKLMVDGNGLYHHTLCPIISIASYLLWELHASSWFVPVIVTTVYGLIMLALNWMRKVDGPYPFFRVHNQSRGATAAWILVLIGIITVISVVIMKVGIWI